jgi:hypothetical protein
MQNVYVLKNNQNLNFPKDKNVIILDNNLFDFELVDGDIFVSYIHTCPLDVRLEYYNIPYNSLVIATQDKDLEDVLEEDNYDEDYAIFSGKKMEVAKKDTKIAILKSFKLMVDVMYQMIEAGYLERKNFKKIDDWIPSFEEPILKLFKIYHKIQIIDVNEPTGERMIGTSNPSFDFEEEFIVNPQFREMLTVMLMKIISNFVIKNDMITSKEVAEMGDWKDQEVWKKLRKKVKLLK